MSASDAHYNPVDWAVVASREALSTGTDGRAVGLRLGLALVLAATVPYAGTHAFGRYQRLL